MTCCCNRSLFPFSTSMDAVNQINISDIKVRWSLHCERTKTVRNGRGTSPVVGSFPSIVVVVMHGLRASVALVSYFGDYRSSLRRYCGRVRSRQATTVPNVSSSSIPFKTMMQALNLGVSRASVPTKPLHSDRCTSSEVPYISRE